MTTRWIRLGLSAAITLGLALPALAQPGTSDTSVASGSGSPAPTCKVPDVDPVSIVSDARPGLKFFAYGATAFRKRDYRHAVYMFEVAASWADEPAEYDLGLMYFRGQGVAVDRPLGAAWMIMAAERGNPYYVHARDLMVTLLTDAEFQRMNELWNELKNTYGDKAGLPRAKGRWAWVRSNEQLGSRVGGASEGAVRAAALGPEGIRMVAGSAADPSVYRAMWQTDNPYDYYYKGQFADCPRGTVKVEPLQQVSAHQSGAKAANPERGAAQSRNQ